MVSSRVIRYCYSIDGADSVVSVSDTWLAFARENGAPELTRDFVVGESLWEFIKGDTTKLLYKQLVQHVRDTDTTLVVPFRCDSPSVQRDMRLEIKQTCKGEVEFAGVLLSAKPRSYLPVLDARVPLTSDILTLCSCCKRALVEAIGWLRLEDAVVLSHCFEADSRPRLRYSICPKCALSMASTSAEHNSD